MILVFSTSRYRQFIPVMLSCHAAASTLSPTRSESLGYRMPVSSMEWPPSRNALTTLATRSLGEFGGGAGTGLGEGGRELESEQGILARSFGCCPGLRFSLGIYVGSVWICASGMCPGFVVVVERRE